MKVKNSDNKIIIYLQEQLEFNNKSIKKVYEERIKEIMLKLKKRYRENLAGFYEAHLYENKKYGYRVELEREQEIDLFPDLIDLKLTIKEDEDFLMEWEDYFLIKNKPKVYYADQKYYTYLDDFTKDELLNYNEHYQILYGKAKDSKTKKLKLLSRNNFHKKCQKYIG